MAQIEKIRKMFQLKPEFEHLIRRVGLAIEVATGIWVHGDKIKELIEQGYEVGRDDKGNLIII